MATIIPEDKEAERQALQEALHVLSNVPLFFMQAQTLRRINRPTGTRWLIAVTMENLLQTGPDDLTTGYVCYFVWRDEQGTWQTKRVCTGYAIMWA